MFTLLQNQHTANDQLSFKLACSALGVSRSGYSKWIKQKQIHDSDPDEMKLKSEIQKIAIDLNRF